MNEISQQPVDQIPWGSKYIQKLSEDLKEYESGYSFDNLRKMAQFAKEFTYNEIWEQAAPKIPWETIIKIMQKSKSHEEMQKYNKGEII